MTEAFPTVGLVIQGRWTQNTREGSQNHTHIPEQLTEWEQKRNNHPVFQKEKNKQTLISKQSSLTSAQPKV